jgi:hypothetical protein
VQGPALGHWTGVPTHTPLIHRSIKVQRLPSSHAEPFALLTTVQFPAHHARTFTAVDGTSPADQARLQRLQLLTCEAIKAEAANMFEQLEWRNLCRICDTGWLIIRLVRVAGLQDQDRLHTWQWTKTKRTKQAEAMPPDSSSTAQGWSNDMHDRQANVAYKLGPLQRQCVLTVDIDPPSSVPLSQLNSGVMHDGVMPQRTGKDLVLFTASRGLPVRSSHRVFAHWVAGGKRQTTGVPTQRPRPSHLSPVVQFLPSLHGVLAGRAVSMHAPAARSSGSVQH